MLQNCNITTLYSYVSVVKVLHPISAGDQSEAVKKEGESKMKLMPSIIHCTMIQLPMVSPRTSKKNATNQDHLQMSAILNIKHASNYAATLRNMASASSCFPPLSLQLLIGRQRKRDAGPSPQRRMNKVCTVPRYFRHSSFLPSKVDLV